jgi:hypothetical protein
MKACGKRNVEKKSHHKIRRTIKIWRIPRLKQRTHKICRIFAQNPPDRLGTMVYTMVFAIVSTRLKVHETALISMSFKFDDKYHNPTDMQPTVLSTQPYTTPYFASIFNIVHRVLRRVDTMVYTMVPSWSGGFCEGPLLTNVHRKFEKKVQ